MSKQKLESQFQSTKDNEIKALEEQVKKEEEQVKKLAERIRQLEVDALLNTDQPKKVSFERKTKFASIIIIFLTFLISFCVALLTSNYFAICMSVVSFTVIAALAIGYIKVNIFGQKVEVNDKNQKND